MAPRLAARRAHALGCALVAPTRDTGHYKTTFGTLKYAIASLFKLGMQSEDVWCGANAVRCVAMYEKKDVACSEVFAAQVDNICQKKLEADLGAEYAAAYTADRERWYENADNGNKYAVVPDSAGTGYTLVAKYCNDKACTSTSDKKFKLSAPFPEAISKVLESPTVTSVGLEPWSGKPAAVS